MDNNDKLSKLCSITLVAVCLAISLAVPAYWVFANPLPLLTLEKRERAVWPAFTTESMLSGDYGKKIETWMTDKMPLRSLLVGINSYAWYLSGRQTAREVIMAANDALVEAPPAYSAANLERRLEKIASFPAVSGIPATLVVAPNAGFVSSGGKAVPDYLRSQYPDDNVATAVIEMVSAVPDFTFTDLRSQFTESDVPLYYKTDHHWNAEGAYAAYCALGDNLSYTPLGREAFKIERQDGFYGSTYAKSGLWLTSPDTIEMWQPPCGVRVTIGNGENAKQSDSLFFTEHLEALDMYPVFLNGVYDTAIIENLAINGDSPTIARTGATLLIVQDSYANSLIPLLIPHYRRIVAIDPRYYRKPASELSKEYGATQALFVYSVDHIINDPDIVWIR